MKQSVLDNLDYAVDVTRVTIRNVHGQLSTPLSKSYEKVITIIKMIANLEADADKYTAVANNLKALLETQAMPIDTDRHCSVKKHEPDNVLLGPQSLRNTTVKE